MIKSKLQRILFTLATIILFSTLIPSFGTTSYAMAQAPTINSSSTPQVLAELIGYRYKVENGKLYRRLFNYASQQWVGDWECCS